MTFIFQLTSSADWTSYVVVKWMFLLKKIITKIWSQQFATVWVRMS